MPDYTGLFQKALAASMAPPAANKSRSASTVWQAAMQNQPKAMTLPTTPPARVQPPAQPAGWGQAQFEAAQAAQPQPMTLAELAAGQGGWGGDAFQQALRGVQSGQVPIGQYYPQGGGQPLDFSDMYKAYQQMGGGSWGGGGGGGAGAGEMDWLRPWEEHRVGQLGVSAQPYFQDWLESMRGRLQRRYMGQLPAGEEEATESWQKWLQDRLAQNTMYQEWWRRPPWERGIDYGAMAPRMRQIAGI